MPSRMPSGLVEGAVPRRPQEGLQGREAAPTPHRPHPSGICSRPCPDSDHSEEGDGVERSQALGARCRGVRGGFYG